MRPNCLIVKATDSRTALRTSSRPLSGVRPMTPAPARGSAEGAVRPWKPGTKQKPTHLALFSDSWRRSAVMAAETQEADSMS